MFDAFVSDGSKSLDEIIPLRDAASGMHLDTFAGDFSLANEEFVGCLYHLDPIVWHSGITVLL